MKMVPAARLVLPALLVNAIVQAVLVSDDPVAADDTVFVARAVRLRRSDAGHRCRGGGDLRDA